MDEPAARRSTRRSVAATVTVVLTAVVVVAVAAVGVWLVTRPDGPSPAVSERGWSGQAVICPYRERSDALTPLGRGDVLALGDDPRELLRAARCRQDPGRYDGPPPSWTPGRTWFVVGTGSDRFDVRLVGVGGGRAQPELRVEHDELADGCGTTAEYRGQLLLVVSAPPGAPRPRVSLRSVPVPC